MMRFLAHKPGRRALLTLFALLLAGWLLPSFFSAEHYRHRLETGLERALHRPVAFGSISFRLLPHPGFSIENGVVREDPSFGSEPFARVERINCDLRWRSLWHSRLDFARLSLERASFNVVRSEQGEWNFENMLAASGISSPPSPSTVAHTAIGSQLVLDADDARVNFKIGANKKPFAITGLKARLEIDSVARLTKFHLTGHPIRTDIQLPSPGLIELEGEWSPGKDLEGPLHATLRTRGALLYDWVPIVAGYNPELYGLLDAEVNLAGSIRLLKLDGQFDLQQLRRWDRLPPPDSFPISVYFRGAFDRRRGRAQIESLEASFADSRLHLSGSVDKIPVAPELDLALALERTRVEDLLALGRRVRPSSSGFGASGRLEGLVTVRGAWRQRRYGGFVNARNVHLRTQSGSFPVSDCSIRIEKGVANLGPVKLSLAPRVELIADGWLGRRGFRDQNRYAAPAPRYELHLSAKSVPLRDLLRFARGVGLRVFQNLDARGTGTANLRLAGPAWPLTRPKVVGLAELRAAQLLLPGLTEPLNIPGARLQINGDDFVADPVVAVIGTNVFTGRVEHHGMRMKPWRFKLQTDQLSVEAAALWFDSLGHRRPLPEHLPGLNSPGARRLAASSLFSDLNAKGRFSASTVTFRALVMKDFRASVEVSGRMVHLRAARFRGAGGRGQGEALVNLNTAPATVTAEASLTDANLQPLTPFLPPVLHGARGLVSIAGHLETRGLAHSEMGTNLQGQAAIRLKDLTLGDFDPLESLARIAGLSPLEPTRSPPSLTADATLKIAERQASLDHCSFYLAGAKFKLSGTYAFSGAADVYVEADLRHVKRHGLSDRSEGDAPGGVVALHFAGPLDGLEAKPGIEVSRRIQ